ncbi:MAG: class I SAM-dependent methyltransferase [Verrucomicrobia bacterium]|jgi:cephalosporin hydroxylase|nr:class I SAM-dependent methyltransferase [Verrucomicrobiota bacterium]
MFDREEFEKKKRRDAKKQAENIELQKLALQFVAESDKHNYGYQWTWLGLPVIQMPSDMLVTQEIIWECQPDVIIETGVAWGGSVVMYASILELIGKGKVVAVEKVLPVKNRKEIGKYKFSERINLIEGSSVESGPFEEVKSHIRQGDQVMVLLDSNHTHEHVLEELRLYAPLVTAGQFLVVSDTVVERLPAQKHRPRPWGPGNNPMTALLEFMQETQSFEREEYYNGKLLATYSPSGYLKRIR